MSFIVSILGFLICFFFGFLGFRCVALLRCASSGVVQAVTWKKLGFGC